MNTKTKKLTRYILILILAAAFFLRVFKIDSIPLSLSWDEVDVGYNGYSIANYAHDEWGNFLPIVFKSFEDDKNPVHIYITAIFVKILGLSDLSVRLPGAVFGTLNVLLIFFLGKRIFKSDLTGISAAAFLAISPYAIQFSRFNHEANFALFFFMLGLLFFSRGLEKGSFILSASFISFGISILSYHSAKIVVPLIILLLLILNWKIILQYRKYLILGIIFLSILLSSFIFNPALLGTARLQQTSIPKEFILKTNLYQKTHIETLGWLEVVTQRYLSHYSWKFLFESGDQIARHSTQSVGEFYRVDLVFLFLGLVAFILKRNKQSLIILGWALLAPIPASISGGNSEVPHAARAMFMMGSWHLITANGFSLGLSLLRNIKIRMLIGILLILALSWEFKNYSVDYYTNYSVKYATEWQYGMKQIVEYVKAHPNYSQVYMTSERHQPYIFFLYYLKTPLPQFLNSVTYNTSESRSYNLVLGYDQFHFGDWDPIESMPNTGVLYIVTPSEYDGLRHKNQFDVKKIVKYPSGESAFFIVSAP